MAGIDDRALARRQKDLEKFTEYYQERLERITGQHVKNLAPAWQRMTKQLTDQIKKLYEEAGAINDPKKIQALKNKAKRLEALASQITQDLKTTSEKLQPYYTGALSAAVEDSYYFHAWGLEQAAQVGVNVPLLTKAQVLGVISNPWLPDGANYSSRIRANAAYIAAKARETVAKAVANGWSINEAARAMRDVTGEGYFRNVTIMRTELNRAASLGSSYLFMENADILDGKRWNATLDSRTAAKDAANDGKIYDLDYDTPERPGVPGQRIPNHPNCRCKWTPVLSALGVSKKERIARRGDGPDSWGKNYYTKARTYREYARERGLPDLDERLANDNLKQYLRPGETLADLDKKVVRWKHKGGTVSVPRTLWEEAKTTKNSKIKYVLANTIKEAENILKKITGAEKTSYRGLDLKVANEVNVGAAKFLDKFPQVKGFVQRFTTSKAKSYYGQFTAESKRIDEVKTLFKNKITLSNVLMDSEENIATRLAKDIKSGFHPKGFTTQHLIAHEYTHALENYLICKELGVAEAVELNIETWNKLAVTLRGKTVARKIINKALENMGVNPVGREAYEIQKELGRYAFKDAGEMLAQAVADAVVSEKPLKFSQEVLKATLEMLER